MCAPSLQGTSHTRIGGSSLAVPNGNPSPHLHWAPQCTTAIHTPHSNGLIRPRPHVSLGRQQIEQKYPYEQRIHCCPPERRGTYRPQSSSSGSGSRLHQLSSIPRKIVVRVSGTCKKEKKTKNALPGFRSISTLACSISHPARPLRSTPTDFQ